MEILFAFIITIAVFMGICTAVGRKRTDVTEIYIPTETDTGETAKEKLFSRNMRGSKIIICRTDADVEEILKEITQQYGKIYKKG